MSNYYMPLLPMLPITRVAAADIHFPHFFYSLKSLAKTKHIPPAREVKTGCRKLYGSITI